MLVCACGIRSKNKAYFCWKCGHRLRLEDPPADISHKEKFPRLLRSIKLVGVIVFFSILIVALGMGIYWSVRVHSSAEAQIAKSAQNDGSPVLGMPSVSDDGRGPVTTQQAVPPIFHDAENIPGRGLATTEPPPPPIFHEAENPPPSRDHGPATTKPPVPQPTGALNEPDPLKAVDTHGMVRIPGGEFKMGSPEEEVGRLAIESPQHLVSVDTFLMDETEVTNEMYKRFVMDKPEWQKGRVAASLASQFYLENWKGTQYPAKKDKYPVSDVSWYAARAYCESVNKRLPTEAEWEYAARAGTTTAFWWGDAWNRKFANASRQSADSVGKPDHRNKFGLFDMLGNVWEWTSTLYSPYPYNAKDGREDQNSSGPRVIRGGSWGVESKYLRSATRVRQLSQFTREDVGFRCACSSS
jgi:formylglycine-generating enzyme required for sulfatase activity